MAEFNDYGAGAIGAAVKGLLQGMQYGQEVKDRREERDENKRFREMELNARMKAEEEKRARDSALDQYNKQKDFQERRTKLFSEGYDVSGMAPDQDVDYSQIKFRPDYLEAKKREKAAGVAPIKDDPFSADLRTKWLNDPVTKDTRTISSAFSKIKSAGENPSAAGDLSLIFSYMKILDPGSTVREGEFANAQNAAGVPDQIRNLYERVRTGERLNPDQRKDFVGQAKNLYQAQMGQQKNLDNAILGVARRRGMRGEDIVLSDMFDQGLLTDGILKDGMMAPAEPARSGVEQTIGDGINAILGRDKAQAPAVDPIIAAKKARVEELLAKKAKANGFK